MKLLFLDTETTGTNPKENGIIQIAGIIDINGKVEREFNFNVRPFPGKIITEEALCVTKKTREQIAAYPEPSKVYIDLVNIFGEFVDKYDKRDKFYLVGQNCGFDYDFMNVWFQDNRDQFLYAYIYYYKIDLIQVASLFRTAGLLTADKMKLIDLANFFKIDLQAHDAMSDIRATREIYYKLVEIIKKGSA